MNNITNIFEPFKDIWLTLLLGTITIIAIVVLVKFVVKKITKK